MKGEADPPEHDLWGRISVRLAGLPESSQFMHKLMNKAGLFSDHRSERRHGHAASLSSRLSPRSTQKNNLTAPTYPNTLSLDIQSNDNGYMAKFAIGTPPRTFSLLMDSGSADFWVAGEGCQGNDGKRCGNHTFLGNNTSSTFKDLRRAWSIEYNTGTVSGTVAQDDISVASLHLEDFNFGVARKESSEFTGNGILFDGIAGVAKSIASKQKTPTLMEALHKSGTIKNSIVSFKIPRAADNKPNGEMTLGGMNPARYKASSMATVKNVNKFGFWETPISQVKIDGKPTGWTNRTGVLDTGTALLIAPREDVDAIHSQVPGAKKIDGSWAVPCKTNASISLTFGSIDFPINPRDLAFIPFYDDEPDGDCWSGISIGTVGPFNLPTTWLLGDTFLKNVYHSLNADEGKDEITFAKLK